MTDRPGFELTTLGSIVRLANHPATAPHLLGKTLPLIARVFSDRTLKIYARGAKDPTRVIYNVTRSGLTNPSISWCHWLWASCAHHRLQSAVLHDTNMGTRPLRYYAVGCLTTSRHKAVCRVYYRNRNTDTVADTVFTVTDC